MIAEFQKYPIKTKSENNKEYIYDIVRKKWIVSSFEEQVRQMWLHFLTKTHHIPTSNIAVEKGLIINNRAKRFDICVFNKATPWILIECKSPRHKLSIPTFEQLSTYNISLKASVFLITNGVSHFGMEMIDGTMKTLSNFTEIQHLPPK